MKPQYYSTISVEDAELQFVYDLMAQLIEKGPELYDDKNITYQHLLTLHKTFKDKLTTTTIYD